MRLRSGLKTLLVVGALCGTVFASGTVQQTVNQSGLKKEQTVKVQSSEVLTPILSEAQKELHEIIDRVAPSVVTIFAIKVVKVKNPLVPGDFWNMIPPELRKFFNFPEVPQERKEEALGSGFIFKVTKDWVYILTNNHVVSNAKKIMVKIGRLKEVKAQIVGTDPKTDIAVIKVPRKEVPDAEQRVAKLGDSSKVRVGDLVVAIGNPFGLEDTATFGIVSALHRRIGLEQYENYIQTQAPINPGNSGGPLVNIKGEVIGINTAIIANAQGLGFAIPINLAKWVAQQLIEHGKVIRGWLGVVIQGLTPALAEALGLDHGVIVMKVFPGSPAEKAGLQPGDIILAINGKPIKSVTQLQFEVMKTPPGHKLKLTVLRNNKKIEITVTVGQYPSSTQLEEQQTIYYNLGLVLRDATKAELQEYGVPYGVVVVNVYPGSPAAQAGVKPGMLIWKVNNVPVRSVEEFRRVVERFYKEGKPIVLWAKDMSGNFYLITIKNY